MAPRKQPPKQTPENSDDQKNVSSLTTQGAAPLATDATDTITLTAEQVRQLASGGIQQVLQTIKSSDDQQTMQLLQAVFGQQVIGEKIAVESLETLLQVGTNRKLQQLNTVALNHYAQANEAQVTTSQELIQQIAQGGDQILNFLGKLGVESEVKALGTWRIQAPTGDDAPTVSAPVAAESSARRRTQTVKTADNRSDSQASLPAVTE